MNSTTLTTPQKKRAPGAVVRRFLTCVFGPAAGRRVELGKGDLVIGRRATEEVGFGLDDGQASRSHCALRAFGQLGIHQLEDLGSKNGTWLNGQRLEGADHIPSGSVIRVGASLLVYSEIHGASAQMIDARTAELAPSRAQAEAIVRIAAPRELPVLINGPSGAGKERLARQVHVDSGRSGEFVVLNCATISRQLLASELFGHVKGAFSGANDNRAGLFLAAHAGTLFLDEIAELPIDQQAALLRALQEKRIRPVGSDRELPADVRIVAATHQDLTKAIAEGRFRQDLYARLSAVRVELPGITERREEILPLFRAFVGRPTPLSLEAAEALLHHDWPLNVRDLQRAAATIRMFAEHLEVIEPAFLPAEVQRSTRRGPEATRAPTKASVEALLEEHHGKVSKVAEALGKSRQQVYRLAEALGIEIERFRG